jgi:competence protein ComEA
MARGRSPSTRPRRELFKDLLHVHRGERRGILMLMLVLGLLSGWVVYEQWFHTPPPADLGALRAELEQWMAGRAEIAIPSSPVVADLQPFDPNTLSRAEWMALGLTERQADAVLRYREMAGPFRVKADLARVRSLPPSIRDRIQDLVLLPDSLPRSDARRVAAKRFSSTDSSARYTGSARPERVVHPVDVNVADTMELVGLPGIGPAFARGIFRYRERLGGFISLEQLAEVRVLADKPEAVERIRELLFVGEGPLRKIPINSVTVEELAAHPYVSWKVAQGLVNYRQQHGPFRSVEGIRGSVLVNDSLYHRLAPYLSVE